MLKAGTILRHKDVVFVCDTTIPVDEAKAYIDNALITCEFKPARLDCWLHGEEIEIKYSFHRPPKTILMDRIKPSGGCFR